MPTQLAPVSPGGFSYRLEVVPEVLQAGEPLPAGLAGVGPLPGVTAQVALQVRAALHGVGAERALEAHPGQVTWQGQGTQQSLDCCTFISFQLKIRDSSSFL